MNKPVPENKTPMLVSAGLGTPTFTKHKFVETRECEITTVDEFGIESAPQPAYEYIYECTETGEQRRYGVVDRDVVEGN